MKLTDFKLDSLLVYHDWLIDEGREQEAFCLLEEIINNSLSFFINKEFVGARVVPSVGTDFLCPTRNAGSIGAHGKVGSPYNGNSIGRIHFMTILNVGD